MNTSEEKGNIKNNPNPHIQANTPESIHNILTTNIDDILDKIPNLDEYPHSWYLANKYRFTEECTKIREYYPTFINILKNELNDTQLKKLWKKLPGCYNEYNNILCNQHSGIKLQEFIQSWLEKIEDEIDKLKM